MLNYAVDPRTLLRYVPSGTDLDFCDGEAFISIVGFRFVETKLKGLSIPFHRNFEEVNLRFYVRAPDAAGRMRRGVTFIREFVPRRAIAFLARLVYNEPYLALPMSSTVARSTRGVPIKLEYRWQQHGALYGLGAETANEAPTLPPLDSHACFVTEHYWGFTKQRDGRTVEYEVEHPRWRVWPATSATLEGDLTSLYGPVFADVLRGAPRSAWIAEGSRVTVFQPRLVAK
jgi:uncharacterized protein